MFAFRQTADKLTDNDYFKTFNIRNTYLQIQREREPSSKMIYRKKKGLVALPVAFN